MRHLKSSIVDVSKTAIPGDVLIETVSRLLNPLARICVANGVTFAAVDEVLKRAFVQEARSLQSGVSGHGAVSRISTATGITRRETTRLLQPDSSAKRMKPPVATEVFARWTANPTFRGPEGAPLSLKRQGPPPSFEALAQSVTRDIHPRSMLQELMRLGLARYDEAEDSVTLTRTNFVPDGDTNAMVHFLGDNVGDHLDGAVANVLKEGPPHLEQAIFADELSAESMEELRPLITAQWEAMRDALVPTLTALIEADAAAGRAQNQRVRIGLYTFSETTPETKAPVKSSAGPSDESRKGASR